MELGPETYGDTIADVYDDWASTAAGDPLPAVDVLTELAGDASVLELGVGTGRVALPLAARGVEVHGLDSSAAMIDKLRAKPGGETIATTVGDMAHVPVDGSFGLVYVVFNTFFALLTQDEQVGCFQAVARRLLSGGRFLVEAFVPDTSRFDRGNRVSAVEVEREHVRLDVTLHDVAAQRLTAQHVVVSEAGIRLYPLVLRYAYPSELDLMARLAGLELESRWAGWDRAPFGPGSGSHVTVWRRL